MYRRWEQPRHTAQSKVKLSALVPTVGSSSSLVLVAVQLVPTAVGIDKAFGQSEDVIDGDVSLENSRDVMVYIQIKPNGVKLAGVGVSDKGQPI